MERFTQLNVRSRFVHRVARLLDDAGVNYVFLHGYGPDSHDSDLDVAVTQESLNTVDLLLASGSLGRLLQRFDYDIPWCRYYVVEADESARRYRQLDVACDPWGIGRYGPALGVALSHVRVVDGLRTPEPAAEMFYLAVKRARKGASASELATIERLFAVDPPGARTLLVKSFGEVGESVARAIETRQQTDEAVESLLSELDRQRRAPLAVARRTVMQSQRIARRVARPVGLVVGVVGPDGVGKSTLALSLEQGSTGAFRKSVRLHLGPGVLPPPSVLLRRRTRPAGGPHSREPSGHWVRWPAPATWSWTPCLVGPLESGHRAFAPRS